MLKKLNNLPFLVVGIISLILKKLNYLPLLYYNKLNLIISKENKKISWTEFLKH